MPRPDRCRDGGDALGSLKQTEIPTKKWRCPENWNGAFFFFDAISNV